MTLYPKTVYTKTYEDRLRGKAEERGINLDAATEPESWWTRDLHVHATVEINGIPFRVNKCDTQKAHLTPAYFPDDDTEWFMFVRVGEVFRHRSRNYRILAIKRGKLDTEGEIVVEPSYGAVELDGWKQATLDLADWLGEA